MLFSCFLLKVRFTCISLLEAIICLYVLTKAKLRPNKVETTETELKFALSTKNVLFISENVNLIQLGYISENMKV